MKPFLVLAIVVGMTMPIGAAEIERQVTEKTTTYRGTVTQVDPGSSTIILRSDQAGDAPQTYSFTEKTTFVDENGNVVSRETIRNQPVTVTYSREGDRMIVTKVVVSRPAGGGRTIQRKETTTEEHTIE